MYDNYRINLVYVDYMMNNDSHSPVLWKKEGVRKLILDPQVDWLSRTGSLTCWIGNSDNSDDSEDATGDTAAVGTPVNRSPSILSGSEACGNGNSF